MTGVDRGAKEPDAAESGAPAQQHPDCAPAGAYSRDLSGQSQSDSQLTAVDVPSSHPAGDPPPPAAPPAADTAAQEEHYAGVSAMLAAADTQDPAEGPAGAESPADQTGIHRGREWGFGSFFMNRQGSRNPSFSANLDDVTAVNGRPPPPPVYTRSSPSAAWGKESPGTGSTEQGSTIVHASPQAASPSRPPLAPSSGNREIESSTQKHFPSQDVPQESEGTGWAAQQHIPSQGVPQKSEETEWAAQSPARGWGQPGDVPHHTTTHASVDASTVQPAVSIMGDTGYGWLGGKHESAAAPDTNDIASGTAAEQIGWGQGDYSGFGAPTSGKPQSPLTVRSRTDAKSDASLSSGGGWLGGGNTEVAAAEDVAVDARGEVQYASTPRAAESCTTPFRAGAADTFAGGSFFEDPAMQLDAKAVEAEAPGIFFGTATTPRAADCATPSAVSTGAPPSFFDEAMSQTPRAGRPPAEVQQSFFSGTQYDSAGATDAQQQHIAEAEDVAIDAYGQVQYASTPTPRTTSATFFGDYRPTEDPPAPAIETQDTSQYVWGAGASRWGTDGTSSAVVASSDMPGALHLTPGAVLLHIILIDRCPLGKLWSYRSRFVM